MRSISLLPLLGLLACGGSDSDETVPFFTGIGTADSDGDGLTDLEEFDIGTDASKRDSDGDGFNDLQEVNQGTNPNYEYSHTYTGDYRIGMCPNPPSKKAMEEAAPSVTTTVQGYTWPIYAPGDTVANHQFLDVNEELVDLYSFCGRPIMLAVGAEWCEPCHDKADHYNDWLDEYPDLVIIEILNQDKYGNWTNTAALNRFSSRHGLDRVPVGVPASQSDDWSNHFERDGYIPTTVFITPEMVIDYIDVAGSTRTGWDPGPYFED